MADDHKYTAEIRFTLEKPTSIMLRIYNQNARPVDIRHFWKLPAGENCIPCTITDFNYGEVFSYIVEKENEPAEGDVIIKTGIFVIRPDSA